MSEPRKIPVTDAGKLLAAKKLLAWLEGHKDPVFAHSLAGSMCEMGLRQIIKHGGRGVLHPSTIVEFTKIRNFEEQSRIVIEDCINNGLVQLTQHGGKGSDVRRTITDLNRNAEGVKRIQEWIESQHSGWFKNEMPVYLCNRALQEIQENGNKGQIHPSIIFAMASRNRHTDQYKELVALCLQAGLVQTNRIEQEPHISFP